MSTATAEKSSPTDKSSPAAAPATSAARSSSSRKLLLVGLDLGTNKSCLLAGPAGSGDIVVSKVVPTIVGHVKDGIVDGIIAGNAEVIFGEKAIEQKLHVQLENPLEAGVIARPEATREFLHHLRSLADPSGQAEVRAVVGVPANADEKAREDIRSVAQGIFQRIILIPEPFLAALGFRDDSRLGQSEYHDPATNSLFIDIGAGTTDLCLVQGYFPTANDQISIPFAGDSIDELMREELDRSYPGNGLSRHTIREIKEANCYVGPSRKPLDVKVIIGGKSRVLELGDVIGRAANALLDRIYPALTTLISRAASDSVITLLQNIIVTGGGSQIRGIDTVLQKKLVEDGYETPKVRLAGQDYKRYVAIGALKAARAARENQWQYLLD